MTSAMPTHIAVSARAALGASRRVPVRVCQLRHARSAQPVFPSPCSIGVQKQEMKDQYIRYTPAQTVSARAGRTVAPALTTLASSRHSQVSVCAARDCHTGCSVCSRRTPTTRAARASASSTCECAPTADRTAPMAPVPPPTVPCAYACTCARTRNPAGEHIMLRRAGWRPRKTPSSRRSSSTSACPRVRQRRGSDTRAAPC